MRSLVYSAIVCATTFGSISVADAMPAAPAPVPAASTIGGAQLDKVVLVVTRKVVRRPRRVVKRVIIRR